MRVLSARGGELEQDFGYGVVRQLLRGAAGGDGARAARARARRGGGARRVGADPAGRGVTATAPAIRDRCCTACTGCRRTSRPTSRCCSRSTTRTGPTARRSRFLVLPRAPRRGAGAARRLRDAHRATAPAPSCRPSADAGLVGGVLRPSLLSEQATIELVERPLGSDSCPEFARACRVATAGNPFLLQELLRALRDDGIAPDARELRARRPDRAAARSAARRSLACGALATPPTRAGVRASPCSAAAPSCATLPGWRDLEPEAAGAAADALTRAASCATAARWSSSTRSCARRSTARSRPPSGRQATSGPPACWRASGAARPSWRRTSSPAEPARRPRRRALPARGGRRGRAIAARRRRPARYLSARWPSHRGRRTARTSCYELGSAELPVGRSAGASATCATRSRATCEPCGAARRGAELRDRRSRCTGRIDEGLAAARRARSTSSRPRAMSRRRCSSRGCSPAPRSWTPRRARRARARLARYAGRLRGDTLGERLLLAALAFDAVHRPVPAARMRPSSAERRSPAAACSTSSTASAHAATSARDVGARLRRSTRARRRSCTRSPSSYAPARGSLIALCRSRPAARCQVRFRQGRLAEAEAEARSCLEAAGHAWITRAADAHRLRPRRDARARRRRGLPGVSRRAGHRRGPRRRGSMASRLLYSRGHLRLATAMPAGALRDFEQIRARDRRSGMETAAVPTRACAALALAQLGEHAQARARSPPRSSRSRASWDTPSALSFALRASGIVIGGGEGLELLREAAAAVEHSPARYERALVADGVRRRAAPRRPPSRRPPAVARGARARRPLRRDAHRDPCPRGAARHRRAAAPDRAARRRRADAERAPRRPPGRRRPGNREVAQALFVTVRTVEGHLTQRLHEARHRLARAAPRRAGVGERRGGVSDPARSVPDEGDAGRRRRPSAASGRLARPAAREALHGRELDRRGVHRAQAHVAPRQALLDERRARP